MSASRFVLTAWIALLATSCSSPPLTPEAGHAVGFVYHDANENGVRDSGERGIGSVAVSNGRDVVRTDRAGRYRIPLADDSILFVIKPRGWMTPLAANGLPRFHYIHKPAGSPPNLRFSGSDPTGPLPDSIDFPLTRSRESDVFSVVLFGDTQPYGLSEIEHLSRDVLPELVGSDASFGVTLGDLVGDDLSLFEPLNRAIARIGIPWYNVPGNHDMNFRAADDRHAYETFARVYGPPTYAFQYGRVHFIVLDDVIYKGYRPEGNTTQNYVGGLHDDQLRFIARYLEDVPRQDLVVLLMHVPLVGKGARLEVPQRRALLGLLSEHPHTFSISAHTHMQAHHFLGPEEGYTGADLHHHLNHATVSGSWWLGAPDEIGLPHATMRCGAPNGYSIVRFEGNRYRVRFKAARRPAEHQMHVYAPNSLVYGEAADAEVLVNVFAGSERSRVEMRLGEDGAWQTLERVAREDPFYAELVEREASLEPPPSRRPLPGPVPSPHLWAGPLPAAPGRGTHALEVRTIDMFGQEDKAVHLIRVE